jgi:hypothetical protein
VFSEHDVRDGLRRRVRFDIREVGRWSGDAAAPYRSLSYEAVGQDAPEGRFLIVIDEEPTPDEGVLDRGFSVFHLERGASRVVFSATADRANVSVAWEPRYEPLASEALEFDPPNDARQARLTAQWRELTRFLSDL